MPSYPGARELSDRRDNFYHECEANFYHHVPDRASSTVLKQCLKSGAHAQYQINWPMQETDAMRFGTLVHLILEMPTWRDVVVISPKFDLRRKGQKEAKREWYEEAEGSGKIIATTDQMKALVSVERSCEKNDTLQSLLDGGRHEVSGFWQGEFDVPCKFRADLITADKVVVDFKTCQDASRFKWDAKKYNYALQAAHYMAGFSACEGIVCEDFMFVAIENKAPYGIMTYYLDTESVAHGKALLSEAMLTYKENEDSLEWSGYPDIVHPLSLT